jgi:hypothetical protein
MRNLLNYLTHSHFSYIWSINFEVREIYQKIGIKI